jgi:hypothetical protein
MGMEAEWRLRIMTKVGAKTRGRMAVGSVKKKVRRPGRRGNVRRRRRQGEARKILGGLLVSC